MSRLSTTATSRCSGGWSPAAARRVTGSPLGQRLRPAAQLHHQAESASPRADAAANDSASNGPAGRPNANHPTNVSVATRAHDANRHTDHRANARASHRADGPGNATPRQRPPASRPPRHRRSRKRPPRQRPSRPPHRRSRQRPPRQRPSRPPHRRSRQRPPRQRPSRPPHRPRTANPADAPCHRPHQRPPDQPPCQRPRQRQRQPTPATPATHSIADARTDNARAYPLKRSFSPGFTAGR